MTAFRTLIAALALAAIALPAQLAVAADDQPSEKEVAAPAKGNLAEAKALIEAKQYEKAISQLKEARSKDDKNPDIHNYLGFSYRKLGAYEESMKAYDKALALDPNHKGALEYKGELYLQLGMRDKAQELQLKLESLCPNGCAELTELKKAIAGYQPKKW
jgi:Flp pilus assembly protein TadD